MFNIISIIQIISLILGKKQEQLSEENIHKAINQQKIILSYCIILNFSIQLLYWFSIAT